MTNQMLQIAGDQVSFELHVDALKLTKEVSGPHLARFDGH